MIFYFINLNLIYFFEFYYISFNFILIYWDFLSIIFNNSFYFIFIELFFKLIYTNIDFFYIFLNLIYFSCDFYTYIFKNNIFYNFYFLEIFNSQKYFFNSLLNKFLWNNSIDVHLMRRSAKVSKRITRFTDLDFYQHPFNNIASEFRKWYHFKFSRPFANHFYQQRYYTSFYVIKWVAINKPPTFDITQAPFSKLIIYPLKAFFRLIWWHDIYFTTYWHQLCLLKDHIYNIKHQSIHSKLSYLKYDNHHFSKRYFFKRLLRRTPNYGKVNQNNFFISTHPLKRIFYNIDYSYWNLINNCFF